MEDEAVEDGKETEEAEGGKEAGGLRGPAEKAWTPLVTAAAATSMAVSRPAGRPCRLLLPRRGLKIMAVVVSVGLDGHGGARAMMLRYCGVFTG